MTKEIVQTTSFFSDVEKMLVEARSQSYRAINSIMVQTYWNMKQFYLPFPQFSTQCVENLESSSLAKLSIQEKYQ